MVAAAFLAHLLTALGVKGKEVVAGEVFKAPEETFRRSESEIRMGGCVLDLGGEGFLLVVKLLGLRLRLWP